MIKINKKTKSNKEALYKLEDSALTKLTTLPISPKSDKGAIT